MRTLVTCSAICALALMVGCGSDSDANTGTAAGGAAGSTGGTANAGGDSATGGASATGGSSSTDACNVPACLGDLLTTGCTPSGPCTKATTATAATDKCFESGVKTETLVSLLTASFTMTAKNATSTCYSFGGAFSAFSVKDGSGTEIGTGSVDLTTMSITVACNGAQPVVLNAACNFMTDALNPFSSSCTAGTCTF